MYIPVTIVLVAATGYIVWKTIIDPFGGNQPYRKERTRLILPNGERLELVSVYQSNICFPQIEQFLRERGYTILTLSEFEKLFLQNLFSLGAYEAYLVYETTGAKKGIWEITIETYGYEDNREVDFKARKIGHFEDIQFTRVCVKKTITLVSKLPEKINA